MRVWVRSKRPGVKWPHLSLTIWSKMNLASTVLGNTSFFPWLQFIPSPFDFQTLIVKISVNWWWCFFGTHLRHLQISKFSPDNGGQGLIPLWAHSGEWRPLKKGEPEWASQVQGWLSDGRQLPWEQHDAGRQACRQERKMAALVGGDVKLSATWKNGHVLWKGWLGRWERRLF